MTEKINLSSLFRQKKLLTREYFVAVNKYETKFSVSMAMLKGFEDLFAKSWEEFKDIIENNSILAEQFYLACDQITKLIYNARLAESELDKASQPYLSKIQKIEKQIEEAVEEEGLYGSEKLEGST